MKATKMKQGDLWYANLNSVVGSEQAGMRPLLIISGNLLNTHLNVVICCPLTTKIKTTKEILFCFQAKTII